MNVLVIGKAKTGTTVISKTIQATLGEGCEYYLEPQDVSFFDNDQFLDKKTHRVVKIIFEHWDSRPALSR